MIEQAVVSLTPEAQSRLRELLAKEENPGLALRIFVSGGGCSGMQYGMAFDDQRRADDLIIENEGVQIVVDDFSVNYIRGSEIDYVDSLMGAGFTVHNPNAVHSCSCGHSFDTGNDSATARSCERSCKRRSRNGAQPNFRRASAALTGGDAPFGVSAQCRSSIRALRCR